MNTKEAKQSVQMDKALFDFYGKPSIGQSLPLAIQHVLAMIVGCVTPSIIVAGVAGLSQEDSVILIQAALVMSALTTLIQLFPFIKTKWFTIGAGLPVMMGISFAYVPSMQAIAADFDIATILGAQIVGGIIALLVGLNIKRIRKFFPPLITGTVVFSIGLSLYPTAINYMAGGASSENYGSWKNWLVAIITLIIVTTLNHFGKGIWKLASILIGIIGGYIVALCFGMVDFSSVAQAAIFQLPKPMHFGIKFEPSSCVALGILFAINSVQAIGDFSATTTGSMDRMPTDTELSGGIVGYGISNIFCAFFGGLPTATYSQNVGIVSTTKVISRRVLGIAAAILINTDYDSLLRAGRSNNFCICINCNDRYEADYNRADGFPQYNSCWTCSCSRHGCDSGKCITGTVPGLGNDYIWKITGSSCNYCSDCVKLNSAKSKEVDFEFVGRGFLKEGNPFLKASVL